MNSVDVIVNLSTALLLGVLIGIERQMTYLISIKASPDSEVHLRTLLAQLLGASPLLLRSLSSEDVEDGRKVMIKASVITNQPNPQNKLEEIVARLSLEPSVTSISWHIQEEFIQEQ